MNSIVNELFIQIQSNEASAVTEISFVLEMHAWGLSNNARVSRYESLVRRELIDLNLGRSSIMEIVDFLKNKIQSKNPLTYGLLFVIGKTSCDIGILPLLDIFESRLMNFNENEFYQALVSLESLIFFDESLPIEDVKTIIKRRSTTKLIARKNTFFAINFSRRLRKYMLAVTGSFNIAF